MNNKFYDFQTKRMLSIVSVIERKNKDGSKWNPSCLTDRGKLPLSFYDLEKLNGKNFDNFLTYAFTAMIHKSVVALLKSGQHTGWRSDPVSIKIKKGVVNYDYEYWVITGKCGPLIAGDIKQEIHKTVNNHTPISTHRLGVRFEMDTWDGSDFFMSTDMSGYLLMTERAKKVIESIDSKNVSITPIEELKVHQDYHHE